MKCHLCPFRGCLASSPGSPSLCTNFLRVTFEPQAKCGGRAWYIFSREGRHVFTLGRHVFLFELRYVHGRSTVQNVSTGIVFLNSGGEKARYTRPGPGRRSVHTRRRRQPIDWQASGIVLARIH